MGNILGYARASTSDQDNAGQIAQLILTGATNVFCDMGSDPSTDRSGLAALLAAVRPGDVVAVVGLDRLGRTINETLATVATLKQRGIGLMCLAEQIDTRSVDGKLILHLFGVLARCERRLTAERTQSEIAAAIPHGRRRGRPPLDTDKITAALRLVEAGLSPSTVARQLRLGRSTVYREVRRAGLERILASRPG